MGLYYGYTMIYPIHHSGKIQWPQDRNLGERMKLSRKLKSGGCSNYCDTFIVPLCLSNHGVNDFLKLFGLEGSRKTLTWILHSNILKILFSPSSASFMEKMSDDPDPVGPRIPGSKQQFLVHHGIWNMVKPMDVLRCLFVAMDCFTKWRVSLGKAPLSGEVSIATFGG